MRVVYARENFSFVTFCEFQIEIVQNCIMYYILHYIFKLEILLNLCTNKL